MPCLDPGFAGEGGWVTERLIDYFTRRAEGGVAMILVGPAVFDPLGVGGTFEYRIYRQEILDGLGRLVEAIHRCGAAVGLQMHHAGRQANPRLIEGSPVAPSAVPCPVRRTTPRPLSIPEIEGIIQEYGIYAKKAQEAGFDALEVHGSHGYLIAQFLSPFANHRQDAYGGSLENRMRFGRQVIQEVRRNVGWDFPLFFRLAGDEHVAGGLTPEETPSIAKEMERAGADVIHVSAGTYRSAEWIVPPMTLPKGCNVPAAGRIKERVSIPVAVAGRISGPELAEKILQEGQADIIAMARALVADPDLPRKAMEGKIDEIRRCIACNECIDRLFAEKDIVCTVNPEVGRETEWGLKPAETSKRIMVIGGGPGGLEAARVARLRGHTVSLFEEDGCLGGWIEAASQAPFKGELRGILDYYEKVLKALGVEIRLGTKVTAEMATAWKPDAVVIATGSIPILPPIPGINLPHVIQAVDVLLGKARLNGSVAVVGGGTVGCEVAAFLAQQGVGVTVIEMLPYLTQGIPRLLGKTIKDHLKKSSVQTLTDTRVIEIQKREVIVEEKGNCRSLFADWVVLAVGAKPRDELIQPLKERFQEVYVVGDCREPRKALDAIAEGAEVARAI
jgi:2,4-dienoyl-CoA reductase-like NADH-dependent reductase (Old Yellow Enzyme family)/thioredoxin reductase